MRLSQHWLFSPGSEWFRSPSSNKEADDNLVQRINCFKGNYRLCIQNYFKGKHARAYQNFKDAVDSLGLDFGELIHELDDEVFYRARVNMTPWQFLSSEMFHIGLDKRTIVKTERYSFPGLPCLYMGASCYSCWVELNCPKMEEFQVALIKKKNKNRVKIIDISLLPNQECDLIKTNREYIKLEKYLLLWPLIAMCSIKVKQDDMPFKSEYIFPQFMLEYALDERHNDEKKVDGIKYASVKMANISEKQYYSREKYYVCYVFPVKSPNDAPGSKDESLAEIFEVYTTRSGRILQILTDSDRDDGEYGDIDEEDEKENIYLDEKGIKYQDTVFHRIEMTLQTDMDEKHTQYYVRQPESEPRADLILSHLVMA